MKFRVIDGCPVPLDIADEVQALHERTSVGLNSAFRGDQAEGLLRRLGKSTQRMLWIGWITYGYPRFNPANPPRQSTHECYSDGVAYRGPRGRLLASWQCGLDWQDSQRVLAEAQEMGLDMFRPYSDGREYHHLNFRRRPKPKPSPLRFLRGVRHVASATLLARRRQRAAEAQSGKGPRWHAANRAVKRSRRRVLGLYRDSDGRTARVLRRVLRDRDGRL